MSNTAHVTGGKPIAVRSRSISDVSFVNPLVAFYDIYGRKGEVLFFCSVPDTTQDNHLLLIVNLIIDNVVLNFLINRHIVSRRQLKHLRS
jgi:hypothetical protein